MNLRTFRIGGVHPEENKITAEMATQVAPLPKQAIFPLGQHIGAPASHGSSSIKMIFLLFLFPSRTFLKSKNASLQQVGFDSFGDNPAITSES